MKRKRNLQARPFGTAARMMGGALLTLLIAVPLVGSSALAQTQPPPLSGAPAAPSGFGDLVSRVSPAVVNVATKRAAAGRAEAMPMPQVPPGSPFEEFFREFFDRDREQQTPQRSFSLGSGFVIDPEGFVVTNNHVIADADEITVVFSDDKEYQAELVGRDPKTDLALLKISSSRAFPYVTWADSDDVRVGDWMVAIGNPFGLGSTVTAGIVSARGRDIRAGPYDDFIQVDAAINRGNSGGPSFTLGGQVLGVNTAIFSPSGGNVGIGFAIPANLAKPVIDSLKDTGRVARGWLGVRIQAVTPEIAESLSLPDPEGALIASVTPDGPAEKAQIRAGDVILEFDGKRINRMRNLPRIVAETSVGREADVVFWRDGEEQHTRIVLGELPDDEQLASLNSPEPTEADPSGKAKINELGLVVSGLSEELRSRFNIGEDVKGVVVTEVENEGSAADEGLRAGDVILEVGQEEVGSAPELLAKVKQAKQEGKKAALLLVDRQGDLRFLALRLQ